MLRDGIIAVIIAALTTYLPFWTWNSNLEQITGIIAIATVAFFVLFATDNRYKIRED